MRRDGRCRRRRRARCRSAARDPFRRSPVRRLRRLYIAAVAPVRALERRDGAMARRGRGERPARVAGAVPAGLAPRARSRCAAIDRDRHARRRAALRRPVARQLRFRVRAARRAGAGAVERARRTGIAVLRSARARGRGGRTPARARLLRHAFRSAALAAGVAGALGRSDDRPAGDAPQEGSVHHGAQLVRTSRPRHDHALGSAFDGRGGLRHGRRLHARRVPADAHRHRRLYRRRLFPPSRRHPSQRAGLRAEDAVIWLQRSPVALDVVLFDQCVDGRASDPVAPSPAAAP